MWQTRGHERVYEQFERAIARNRLSGSYLFIGPEGVGKRLFATELAKALLCLRNGNRSLEACGECASCREIAKNSHPDFEYVCKPEDKSLLPLELLIGTPENRNASGLCHFLSVAPQFSPRKAAILDDADFLNAEGANSLLKTLEEPSPHAVIFLLGTSAAKQLPTIRSRCRIVRFNPLPENIVTDLLLEKKIVADADEAARYAQASQGSITTASDWARPGFWEFRTQLLELLGRYPFSALDFSKTVGTFSEAAGKSSAVAKRAAIHCAQCVVLAFLSELNRALCQSSDGKVAATSGSSSLMEQSVLRQSQTWKWPVEALGDAIERTLQFEEELYRNVNSGILIDSWSNELAGVLNYGRIRPLRY